MKRLLFLSVLWGLLGSSYAHAQLYSVTDLGTLGGTSSQAYGINSSGTVVGSSAVGGQNHAFVWSGGVMTDLGLLPGMNRSDAYGINNSGQIVGDSLTGFSNDHAFIYSGGVMTDLGTLPGGTVSRAYAINSSGEVAGFASTSGAFTPHAFSWTSSGGMVDVGSLGSQGTAHGINDSGQISGSSAIGSFDAFIDLNGVKTDLGTLPGGSYSNDAGINSSGQVVGLGDTSSGDNHAFLYSAGVMNDLGTLGGNFSEARGINASGVIVGDTKDGSGTDLAFIYSGGVMVDLNTQLDGSGAGWVLQQATAINDLGQIVGFGTIGGQTHAFLLTPEPSTCVSLAAGLGMFSLAAWRRYLS